MDHGMWTKEIAVKFLERCRSMALPNGYLGNRFVCYEGFCGVGKVS